jgi:HK97 family phage major capsid protein
MDNRIIELIAERYGLFRQLAEVVPMFSDTKEQPRWTGGMTGYWIVEGSAPTKSDPSWDMISLTARKLGAMTKITDELEEDAVIDFGEKLTMMVALTFGEKEDSAGFNGDGTSTYGGIVGLFTRLAESANAASLVTAASGHTTPATLTIADFDKVIGTYPNYPKANPVWLMHKQVYYASAVNLEITASGGLTPGDVRGRAVPIFRGYPVQFVNSALTLAASTAGTIPIAFGDLKLSSKFGDRRTNRTLKRGYENDDFTRGVTSLIATERLDITARERPMHHVNKKVVLLTPPAAIVDNAAFTTAALDTYGFDEVEIYVAFGAMDIAVAVLKVQESDDSGMSGAADITGAILGTSANDTGSTSTLPSATSDNTIIKFEIDMRGRKRYLDVSLTGGDGSAGTFAVVLASSRRRPPRRRGARRCCVCP